LPQQCHIREMTNQVVDGAFLNNLNCATPKTLQQLAADTGLKIFDDWMVEAHRRTNWMARRFDIHDIALDVALGQGGPEDLLLGVPVLVRFRILLDLVEKYLPVLSQCQVACLKAMRQVVEHNKIAALSKLLRRLQLS
jgi:hypothetical protein